MSTHIDVLHRVLQITRMVKFEQTFRDAVANAERDVMIEQIRATPEMTIA